MHQYEKISTQEALQLIHYAIQKTEKEKRAMAVAVSGPEGELIAFARMDDVNPASSQIARNKAFTAATTRQESFKLGERIRTKGDHPSFWGNAQITGFGGGVPIIQNDKVIGALGISGLPEADDIALSKETIKEVFGY